jgi:3-oxoacyl-[acyl-carrier protein] reductase
MLTLDFTGKQVLVTGGSSGIGNAAAQAFRRCGASVMVTGTRASAADYADSDMTGLAYRQLDASDTATTEAFDPGLSQLDVLVNAIGMVEYGRKEFGTASFQKVLQTNLTSFMQLSMRCHPLLKASGGAIVNVGSVASFKATMGNPAYSASKGGVLTLTRSLAQAFAVDGIRVNMLAPGLIKTKMTEVTWANDKRLDGAKAIIPLRRMGTPDEMANVILFLASDLASFITGEMIVADGGMTA